MKELEESRISATAVKAYLSLLIKNRQEFTRIEFKTVGSWLVYSFSFVLLVCVPLAILLFMIGILSGNLSVGASAAVSLIPFLYIFPLTLLLTFLYNYWLPKKLRRLMLRGLHRYDWDGPIVQTGRAHFESIKDNYVFRTEAHSWKNSKGREKWAICMFVPYHLPSGDVQAEACIRDAQTYLEGKSFFSIRMELAYFTVPENLFLRLNLKTGIDELLYAMRRFHLTSRTFYDPGDILRQVPSTPEVVAMTVFGREIDERWTEWAGRMLDAGFSNEHMKNFARQQPGETDQKERREQMDELIREFNLSLTKENVLNNYILFLSREEERGKRSVAEVIRCLNDLYVSSGSDALRSFNLLYRAKNALEATGAQDVWPEDDLSGANIDAFIMDYLNKWLEKAPQVGAGEPGPEKRQKSSYYPERR